LFEDWVKGARAEGKINYGSDDRDKDRRTFFEEPSWNRIKITLFIRGIRKNFRNFSFSCGAEGRKVAWW
jgi:hypothetical protein